MQPVADDQRYCVRHDQHYPLTGACSGCVASPGQAPDAVVDDPDYQRNAAVREAAIRDRASELWAQYEARIGAEDWHDINAAIKCADVSLKHERLAEEMREKRDAREHELTLIRHERQMQGLRGSH